MNTNDLISLMKEKESLKLQYHNYKRKYKALNRVLRGKLYYRIEYLKGLYVNYTERLRRDDTPPEVKEAIRVMLKFLSQERQELEAIYEMCVEVSK